MPSKKEQAKRQASVYRIFLQRQRKANKHFHLGRVTYPKPRRRNILDNPSFDVGKLSDLASRQQD